MTRQILLGNLPVVDRGINKGKLDRSKTAELIGWNQKQVYKAYNNWIQIFRMEGSTLTFEQYILKLKEVGITPEQVGNSIDSYHLSRYNDEGPYTHKSCRFITKKENLEEMVPSNPYQNTLMKYGPIKTKEFSQKAGSKRWNGSLAQ